MKFKCCENCVSNFDDVMHCIEICMLPINIIEAVEKHFNESDTCPEDLESDLYDIVS